jgi:hypothetical protein
VSLRPADMGTWGHPKRADTSVSVPLAFRREIASRCSASLHVCTLRGCQHHLDLFGWYAHSGTLPAGNIDTPELAKFFLDRDFTLEEGAALMGSHALIDDQGCYRCRHAAAHPLCMAGYDHTPSVFSWGLSHINSRLLPPLLRHSSTCLTMAQPSHMVCITSHAICTIRLCKLASYAAMHPGFQLTPCVQPLQHTGGRTTMPGTGATPSRRSVTTSACSSVS